MRERLEREDTITMLNEIGSMLLHRPIRSSTKIRQGGLDKKGTSTVHCTGTH